MEQAPPQPPAPESWLGSWRLDRLIHVGKHAYVYRAVTAEGVVGALKCLRSPAIGNRTAAERFAREIAVLQGLMHPAIPKVLDQGIAEDTLAWFVTPWFVGWDLETHRQRLGGSLPIEEVLDTGIRALEALEHAHSAGFLHRDVKPANLFLTETGDLKILDFGLCRGLAAAMEFGLTGNFVIGTRGFMAPEQAIPRLGPTDARTDLWSVGATLFLLATGRPVHEGSPEEQMSKVYLADAVSLAKLLPSAPAELVVAVDRALQRDPSARWQNAREMCDQMRRAYRPSAARYPTDPRPQPLPVQVSPQRLTTEQDRDEAAASARRSSTLLRVLSTPDSSAERERVLPWRKELLLGRDVGQQGWSIADARISRLHACIAWDELLRCYRVSDRESTNGVRINGRRQSAAPVSHGDVLRIGDTLLIALERSPMEELRSFAERVAPSSATLLLTGETGVGKEVLARRIHEWSGRRGAFVPVNCGALPREIAASELFGHARGAFSGAGSSRRGVFHAAQGGTLLLDEVGELPLELQPILLRALQERAIRPVGADYEQPIDVRVLAATNVRLEAAVAEGCFRPDLYARLAQIQLEIPALRDRRDEILEMALGFAKSSDRALSLTAEAAEALLLYAWPFNVRELENLIKRWCAVVQAGGVLGVEFLRAANPALTAKLEDRTSAPPPAPIPSASHSQGNLLSERSTLEALLAECDGNISEVARRVNTTRAQVYRWMDRHGLQALRIRGD